MTDFRALCAELVEAWDDLPWEWESDFKGTVAGIHSDLYDDIAVARARAALAEPEGPTDEELLRIAATAIDPYESSGISLGEYEPETECVVEVYGSELIAFARAVLARWGHQPTPPAPVPVSERLPGPEDCTTNPRNGQGQWCWGWVQHDPIPYSGRWRMMRREWLADEAVAWLPANALPLPAPEAEEPIA